MSYSIALFLSALIINVVHGYLLFTQKDNRKFSISEHAALHKKAFIIYVIGHLLGGGFFIIFAKEYYIETVSLSGLFFVSLVTVLFEYIQAFIPAKGNSNRVHTIVALFMWSSFIGLGLFSIILVPATSVRRIIASMLYLILIIMLVLAYKHREKLYRYQMIMVLLFYASMFILVL